MRRHFVAMVVMMVVLVAAAAGSSMLYANRVAAESEQKWCSVVTTLDDTYRLSAPSTPTGKQMASAIAALRSDLRCPPA
jgi:hypothetical protein